MQTNPGGPVEYVTFALLLLQIFFARGYLRRWRTNWPRRVFLAVVTLMAVLWCCTLAAIALVWSGTMYSNRMLPVLMLTTVSAIGYFWCLLATLAATIDAAGRFLAARLSPGHSPERRRWLRNAGYVALGAPSAVAAFGVFVERRQYAITELDFPIAGLHPDFDGFRVVQVSDLHISPFLSPREAGRVIDMANELRPDLALFTGDLISEVGDPLNEAIRELVRLRADNGVLGCMGNHEHYVGCRDHLEREAGRSGLIFLRNKALQLSRGAGTLNIAGVDYQRKSGGEAYLTGAERLTQQNMPNLLLSHNPDVFPTAVEKGFQSVLSGHTHGGQVNVEILHQQINPARFRTPFISGLYRRGSASCYVTNGIGTIGMPIRLGAPPEIALLRLRRA